MSEKSASKSKDNLPSSGRNRRASECNTDSGSTGKTSTRLKDSACDSFMKPKKMRRLESKKKKVAAFLEVANAIDEDRAASKQKVKYEKKQEDDLTACDEDDQTGEKKPLSAEESLKKDLKIMQLKQAKILQKKKSMERPKLFTTLENLKPSVPDAKEQSTPTLYMIDLQHLLLYCIQGNLASFKPRWCKLLRIGKLSKIVVLVVQNIGVLEYKTFTNSLEFIFNTFDTNVEMIPPCRFGSSVEADLFKVPVSNAQFETMKRVLSSTTSTKTDNPSKKRKIETMGESDKVFPSLQMPSLNFSRLSLLLNPAELIEERYPIPGSSPAVQSYVYSHESYDRVTEDSPMFGLDAEMCLTTAYTHELTWIAIVNEKMETVYSTLVKPYNKIVNYLTKYSGVTKAMLDPVTTRLEDVQRKLREILPKDSILVGQSLNSDLHALKIFHPYCIDTSVIYNLTGHPRMKTSLKRLTTMFLGETIQDDDTKGHNPMIDAAAALKLVLLKLEKGPYFGDVITGGPAALQDGWAEYETEDTCTETSSSQNMEMSKEGQKMDTVPAQSTSKSQTTANLASHLSQEELARRNLFFKSRGLQDDMYRILAENGKSAARIVSESNSYEVPKSDWMDVVTIPCDDDQKVYKVTKTCVEEKDFTFATFHSFDPSHEQAEKEASLKKTDKMVKKIYKSTPEKSLFCVVFGGRNESAGENSNAMTFLRIT